MSSNEIRITYTLAPSSVSPEEAARRIEAAALEEARRCQAGLPSLLTASQPSTIEDRAAFAARIRQEHDHA